MMHTCAVSTFLACLFAFDSNLYAQAKADWPTYGFDAVRSGHNIHESVLSDSNVAQLAIAWSFAPGPFEASKDSSVSPATASLTGQPVLAQGVSVGGTPTEL